MARNKGTVVTNLPRPAQHLQRVTALFPKFWREYERFRNDRGRGLPEWPNWCYCPLAASYAIISGGGDGRVPFDQAHLIGELGALAAWRPGKGIYRFDDDLFSALVETPVTGDLPVEVLQRLPEWCVYVEAPVAPMHGFFAFLEWDAGDGRTELRILQDVDRDAAPRLVPIILHLSGGTLEDALHAFEAEAATQWAKAGSPSWVGPRPIAEETAKVVRPLLSLLLYLCSDDADYAGDRKPVRPKPVKTNKGTKIIAPEAPTVWDVGMRIGAALRAAGDVERGEPGEGSHASPRPHVRRAHWHTYLTGKGRTLPVVRWVSPVLVGGAGTVPTVRKVGLE